MRVLHRQCTFRAKWGARLTDALAYSKSRGVGGHCDQGLPEPERPLTPASGIRTGTGTYRRLYECAKSRAKPWLGACHGGPFGRGEGWGGAQQSTPASAC